MKGSKRHNGRTLTYQQYFPHCTLHVSKRVNRYTKRRRHRDTTRHEALPKHGEGPVKILRGGGGACLSFHSDGGGGGASPLDPLPPSPGPPPPLPPQLKCS